MQALIPRNAKQRCPVEVIRTNQDQSGQTVCGPLVNKSEQHKRLRGDGDAPKYCVSGELTDPDSTEVGEQRRDEKRVIVSFKNILNRAGIREPLRNILLLDALVRDGRKQSHPEPYFLISIPRLLSHRSSIYLLPPLGCAAQSGFYAIASGHSSGTGRAPD